MDYGTVDWGVAGSVEIELAGCGVWRDWWRFSAVKCYLVPDPRCFKAMKGDSVSVAELPFFVGFWFFSDVVAFAWGC